MFNAPNGVLRVEVSVPTDVCIGSTHDVAHLHYDDDDVGDDDAFTVCGRVRLSALEVAGLLMADKGAP